MSLKICIVRIEQSITRVIKADEIRFQANQRTVEELATESV